MKFTQEEKYQIATRLAQNIVARRKKRKPSPPASPPPMTIELVIPPEAFKVEVDWSDFPFHVAPKVPPSTGTIEHSDGTTSHIEFS